MSPARISSGPAMLRQRYEHLRRMVSRHRRLLAAGLAAAAVTVALNSLAPEPPATTPVVVAASDLHGGAVLAADDLLVRRMLPHTAPAGAAATPDPVLGRILAAPVRAGEPITDVRVVHAPLAAGYGDNLVAAPVRIADADAVALVRVGDTLDVLAPDPTGERPTSVVVQRAPVAALPEPADGATAGTAGALVVLAVSRADAARLARHAVIGPLMITLRG